MYVVISKFDPQLRDDLGYYNKDEWVNLSDFYANGGCNINDYLRIENNQIAVLKTIVKDLGSNDFKIIYVEDPFSEIYPWHYNIGSLDELGKQSLEFFISFKPQAGMKVSIDDIDNLIRGCLRSVFWVAIDFDNDGYIRTDSEMGLVIGCKRNFSWIDQPGIFVEIDPDGPSPMASLGRDLDD